MTRIAHRQQGIGVLGVIFVLLVIGGTAVLAIRLLPHFITYYGLIGGLEKFGRESLVKAKFKMYDDLKEKIFDIEGIYDLKPQDVLTIDKDRNRVIFHVDYTVQEPLFGQLGVYLHFKEDVVRPL